MPNALQAENYFVVVKRTGAAHGPSSWSWHIMRKPKPLGIPIYGDGFPSADAADIAGKVALKELLDGIFRKNGE